MRIGCHANRRLLEENVALEGLPRVSPRHEHRVPRLGSRVDQAVSEFGPRSLGPESCFRGKILNSWPGKNGLVENPMINLCSKGDEW